MASNYEIVSQTAANNDFAWRLMQYQSLLGITRIKLSSLGNLDIGSSLYIYGR